MKFKIYTLGCKVNQYDSGDLKNKLQFKGWQKLNLGSEEVANLVIVNTCTVTTNAHRKDRRMLVKARQENPGAKVVLMGCWYKVYPEISDKLEEEVDLFWPVGDLDNLVTEIDNLWESKNKDKEKYKNSTVKVGPDFIDKPKVEKHIVSPQQGERSRYFMKVQEGCEQFCSYCVIPYSRGKLQSRSVEEVVDEARMAEKAGYNEIILCGIHLGLYNQEKNSQKKDENLAFLIKKIIGNTKNLRVRISSIEINDINDDLIKLLASEKRFCNHLHIPLQGGNDKILHLMNRPYDTKYFQDKINKIRQAVPEMAITADVIVGFPSETAEQHKNTYNFIKQLKLSKLHVFPYSKHERTAAAKMPGHLDNKTKQERARELRALSERLWSNYQKQIKEEKKKLFVIVESIEAGRALAKTEYYFNIEITGQGLGRLNPGQLVKVERDGNKYKLVDAK